MKFILDTNVLSAVLHGDARVEERLMGIPHLDVGLPQPVLAEVAAGIARMPRSRRARKLRAAFDDAKTEYPRSQWSDEVSDRFGELKARLQSRGLVIEDFNIAIAAHALVEGARLVTANTRHFERIAELELENWLETH